LLGISSDSHRWPIDEQECSPKQLGTDQDAPASCAQDVAEALPPHRRNRLSAAPPCCRRTLGGVAFHRCGTSVTRDGKGLPVPGPFACRQEDDRPSVVSWSRSLGVVRAEQQHQVGMFGRGCVVHHLLGRDDIGAGTPSSQPVVATPRCRADAGLGAAESKACRTKILRWRCRRYACFCSTLQCLSTVPMM